MQGKILVIEGTDCSGKATQARLLKEKLEQYGIKTFSFSFPNYESPTGKIIAGPYLGKETVCQGWFPEGAPKVNAKVSAMFFAIDRAYNLPIISQKQKEGYVILFDRYTYSAMAHQGGKIENFKERNEFYEWVQKLEFEMLHLPEPDIKIFLHMPLEAETILRKQRINETLDENERDKDHLKNAENAYLELAKKYQFHTIECAKKEKVESIEEIKTPEEISNEIWNIIVSYMK